MRLRQVQVRVGVVQQLEQEEPPDAVTAEPWRGAQSKEQPLDVRIGQQLEMHYRNVQDMEFTIERGRLYMLQTRDAKRTAAAAVKIAVDMVEEGLISRAEAVGRIEPAHVEQLLRATFDPA